MVISTGKDYESLKSHLFLEARQKRMVCLYEQYGVPFHRSNLYDSLAYYCETSTLGSYENWDTKRIHLFFSFCGSNEGESLAKALSFWLAFFWMKDMWFKLIFVTGFVNFSAKEFLLYWIWKDDISNSYFSKQSP